MGIQNLLKFLKPLARPTHISEFAGQTIGVDAMGWIHRGAVASAVELLKGEETDKFLRFVVHMIMLLKYHRVEPLLVFDGAKIPAKSAEDDKRQQARQKASEEARQLLRKNEEARRAGRKPPVDSRELLTKCTQGLSITPQMIDSVISACRSLNVAFLVAPYEADAQLAYLARTGKIAAAVSEDSDLLAHGCAQVLFKLDKEGNCERLILPLKDGPHAHAPLPEKLRMFTAMCVLGGCDYTHDIHINGLGISTACKFVHKLGRLERVIMYLFKDDKWKKKLTQPQEKVLRGHRTAMVAFTHHRVYDVSTGDVVSASSVPLSRCGAPGSSASPTAFSDSSSASASLSRASAAVCSSTEASESSETEKENVSPEQTQTCETSRRQRTQAIKQADDGWKTDAAGEAGSAAEDLDPLERDDSEGEAARARIVGECLENFRPYALGLLNPRTHQPRATLLNRKEKTLVEDYRSRALVRLHESHILAVNARERQLLQTPSPPLPPSPAGSSACASASAGPSTASASVVAASSGAAESAVCRPLESLAGSDSGRVAPASAAALASFVWGGRGPAPEGAATAETAARAQESEDSRVTRALGAFSLFVEGSVKRPRVADAAGSAGLKRFRAGACEGAAPRGEVRATPAAEDADAGDSQCENASEKAPRGRVEKEVEEERSRVVVSAETPGKGGQLKLSFLAVKRKRVVDVTCAAPAERTDAPRDSGSRRQSDEERSQARGSSSFPSASSSLARRGNSAVASLSQVSAFGAFTHRAGEGASEAEKAGDEGGLSPETRTSEETSHARSTEDGCLSTTPASTSTSAASSCLSSQDSSSPASAPALQSSSVSASSVCLSFFAFSTAKKEKKKFAAGFEAASGAGDVVRTRWRLGGWQETEPRSPVSFTKAKKR
ncbi:XPG N-terminal domain-containing protein [Besnoitia besnoiti]|uniref:Exonuclease 1 n=1 Tax=Besnoitia besnoiti TaxID=94643 RepID=A0A2A9MQW2_BESBE|nr:XPG N-terminal domain-containing protein [Besnoitia besnoiti]PFH38522.1 XPG N-terminal domain-containing protein [Besnoitia besnoiti]